MPLSCHPPEALSNCTACQGACGLVAAGRGKKVNLLCLEEPSAIQVFGFCRLIVVLTNDHSTAAAADAAPIPLPLPPPRPSLPLPLPLTMLLPPPLPLPPQLPPLLPPLLRCRCAATAAALRPLHRHCCRCSAAAAAGYSQQGKGSRCAGCGSENCRTTA